MNNGWLFVLRTLGVALLAGLGAGPVSAAHPPHSQPEIRVGIVLFDGVQIIDFTGPYEVFGTAGFGVTTVSHDGKPVQTAMGLVVTPDHSFAEAPPFDVLLVPGGEVEAARKDPVLLDFVRTRAAKARQVLSVCTGSHILGATGLLDGLQATTFHAQLDNFERLYPKVDVVRDVRWADNGQIITSAGLSSGIDAALHVVSKLRDAERARATALHLEYDWHPEGGFVRTRMADRYLPKLADVTWPDDFQAKRLLAVGDEREWRTRHLITSQATPDALMTLIAPSLTNEGWQPDPSAQWHWRKTIDRQSLALMFVTTPAAKDSYELAITVTADPVEAQ